MSDCTDNIKRIVGIEDVKNRLKALENKNPIPGQRGISYLVGGAVKTASGATASKNVAGTTGLVSKAITAATASAGLASTNSTGTGTNVGTSDKAAATLAGKSFNTPGTYGANDGVVDAAAHFDSPSETIGLGGSELSNTLNGLTGFTDCADKSVEVRFDGMYRPPEGYTTADEDRPYVGWISGHTWGGFGGSSWSSAEGAANSIFSNTFVDGYAGENWTKDSLEFISSSQYNQHVTGSSTGPTFFGVNWDATCTPGVDSNCPLTAPGSYLWPIANTFQLAQEKYTDGVVNAAVTFATHPRDPNASSGFVGETSNMTLCFGAGRMANIQASNAGGTVVREVSAVDGSQVGYARIYDSSNVLVGYSDSAGLANYLP